MVGLAFCAARLGWPMLDNRLFALLKRTLLDGFTAYRGGDSLDSGQPFNSVVFDSGMDLQVKQAYQPTSQGANTKPTIYLHKLADRRAGTVSHQERWVIKDAMDAGFSFDGGIFDGNEGVMIRTESQVYDTKFQVNAIVKQYQQDTIDTFTSSDLVNIAASIMQSANTIVTLAKDNVSLLRITNIRNMFFQDEDGQYQANPSFDLIMRHERTTQSIVPIVASAQYRIKAI
jgi:hypothetical protein